MVLFVANMHAINGSIVEFSLSVECISIGSTAPNEDKNTQKTRRTGKKDTNETNNPDVLLQDRNSIDVAMAI